MRLNTSDREYLDRWAAETKEKFIVRAFDRSGRPWGASAPDTIEEVDEYIADHASAIQETPRTGVTLRAYERVGGEWNVVRNEKVVRPSPPLPRVR